MRFRSHTPSRLELNQLGHTFEDTIDSAFLANVSPHTLASISSLWPPPNIPISLRTQTFVFLFASALYVSVFRSAHVPGGFFISSFRISHSFLLNLSNIYSILRNKRRASSVIAWYLKITDCSWIHWKHPNWTPESAISLNGVLHFSGASPSMIRAHSNAFALKPSL